MACPFFSGQIQDSPRNVEGLNDYEIYHQLLLAYPAYTIERIEEELSWRQVRLLLECWGKEPPFFKRIARIESMLATKLGYKQTPTNSKTSTSVVNKLQGMGLL